MPSAYETMVIYQAMSAATRITHEGHSTVLGEVAKPVPTTAYMRRDYGENVFRSPVDRVVERTQGMYGHQEKGEPLLKPRMLESILNYISLN